MTQLYSSANITRFAQDAEDQFNQEYPCIIDRIGISIVSGTSTYTLDPSVTNIKRITYRGYKLDPLPQRDLRQYFMSGTQQGRPYWYIFNNVGQMKIQLFPVPQETIAAPVSGLWGSSISSTVIVEYYRTSNYTTKTIPTFIGRRLKKAYVLKRCFEIDSKGSNVKASKYWTARWDGLVEMYGQALEDLVGKPRNLVTSPSRHPFGFTPPLPINPVRYLNLSVDDYDG